jgi:hypothetical protein
LAVLAKFGPNLAQFGPFDLFFHWCRLKKLIYALTVVIIFRNVLLAKVLGLYFQNWLFRPDLAQIWPNLVHLKLVRATIMSVVLWRWSSLSKILTESKSWDNWTIRNWNLYALKSADFRCLYLSNSSVNMVFFCFPGLHFISYLTQNINGCPGIVFLWIRGKMIQAQPSVQGMAVHAHLPKRVGWLCPFRSALKRTPVQGFNYFSIVFYFIISTKLETYFALLYFWTFAQCDMQAYAKNFYVLQFYTQIRRQMSLGTCLWYEKSILGWFGQPGCTCEKKIGANYEQLLRPVLLWFHGHKIDLIFFWKYCSVCTEKLHRIKVKDFFF